MRSASLTGSAVVGGSAPDGTGLAKPYSGGDTVTFDIQLTGVEEPITAHIHASEEGQEADYEELLDERNGLPRVVAVVTKQDDGLLRLAERAAKIRGAMAKALRTQS